MFASAALLIAALPLAFAQQAAYVPEEPILSFSYPIPRGNAGEVSNIAPCAGFEQGGRLTYPLTGGDVSITAIKDAKLLKFAYSTNENPQAASDFTSIGEDTRVRHRGSTCLTFPDLASAGLTAGQNVTLQMYWEAGPRNYPGYACADVTLVDNVADLMPINYTCTTSYLSTGTRGNQNPKLNELRAAAEAEFNAEQSKAMADAIWKYGPSVSAPAAGGIGAGVTLAVVAVVLLAGWATGAVAFGKRKAIALKQSTGSYPIQETKSISSSV